MNNTESRTKKSIKNSLVAISFTIVTICLQFFSRKIFLNYLGAEVLGLNTTVVNILQFLNLAELGIGSATTFALYTPLKDKNTESLIDIVSLQGHLYKRIASIIIIGALLVMLFFPLIFKKITLPLWYAYASFLVMLFSTLLGYFINYRQVLLSANQEDYKIAYSYKSMMILKIIFQMAFIYTFKSSGYVWWLVWEAVFALIGSLSLNHMISKTFPFIKKSNKSYSDLKQSYGIIITKIKQLFFHNIGSFVLGQSSTLIIYAYISLAMVANYGNYMIIIHGVTMLINSLFNSLGAGVGNLVAEGDYSKIKKVFIELFSVRFFIVTTTCFFVYSITPPFISLWIGEEYLLDNNSLLIIVSTLYISLFRYTIGAFTAAYGLFHDVYAPLVEATINISLSILLGKYYGLNGILTGVLISQIIIIAIWKPYFLFTRKMKGMGLKYLSMYFKHLIQLAFVLIVSHIIINRISIDASSNYMHLFLYGITCVITFGLMLFLSLYFSKSGIQLFLARFVYLKNL